jgi:GH25 family lysozyme M1 (1,4-beta-N-acetylmuramidase)
MVQLPPGVNVWCDLEGVAAGTPVQDVIAYCQAWYYAVHHAGYLPGIYVGYDVILNPDQLYNDISFQHYWRAYNGPQVTTRGFQLVQESEKILDGTRFDPDLAQNDNLGDPAFWLAA